MKDLFTPSDEHASLRETVRRFAERELEPVAEICDREERFDLSLFRRLGEIGLLGITVDERFGGSGMDATSAVIAHEELSAVDPGFCLAYLAHSILFANNLDRNGSESLRAKYLPDVCTGKLVGGMGMSEPGAGTDVLDLRTTAVRHPDGYRLTGSKMWITNGALDDERPGDVFLVYARVAGAARNELSLFLVDRTFPGFRLGQRIKNKLGMRASGTAELVFEDCLVPVENLVGEEGTATHHMMRNLEIERLTLAAMGLGIARRCIEIMNAHARERQSFGQPIHRYGQIQRHIAESYAEYMAGRSYVYATARALDLERAGQRVDCDGAKLYCATMSKTVADRAIQVLGGYGYVGEYKVERLFRDAKLLEIGGGTLEAHQKNITRDLSRLDRLR